MNNHTILAVNDNADQLRLLAFIFGEAGYRVLTGESAVEGLKIARRELPDLIISDVMMPEMDASSFVAKFVPTNNYSRLRFCSSALCVKTWKALSKVSKPVPTIMLKRPTNNCGWSLKPLSLSNASGLMMPCVKANIAFAC
jgi:CheY-like chemotaxis protein